MTYEARTNGGPWRQISPMRGESLDEVFRQLGPGAEVRQVQEAASEADLWARVEALEGRVSQLEAVREMGAPVGCVHHPDTRTTLRERPDYIYSCGACYAIVYGGRNE